MANPVAKVWLESFYLLVFPLSLFVIKVLYELLPIYVFLLGLLLVGVYLGFNVAKSRNPEVGVKKTSAAADQFLAELEKEDSKRVAKGAARKNSKMGHRGSKGSVGSVKLEDNGTGRGNEGNPLSDDDEDALQNWVEAQKKGRKAVR